MSGECAHSGGCKASEEERSVARWVAGLVERGWGIRVGPHTDRDGRDGSGLTVDFTFEGADPPFALEVTRLRDDFESWGERDIERFARDVQVRLKRRAWSMGLFIGLRPETPLKDLGPVVESMVEWMEAASLEELGPGTSSADVSVDLYARLQAVPNRDFTKECEEARLRGLVSLRRIEGEEVFVLPIRESSDHQALMRPIARALVDKGSGSLGKAKAAGYVTFLAIDVQRRDAQAQLVEGTRLWDFPAEVDHLFLVVREDIDGSLDRVFYANRTRDGRRLRSIDISDLD